MTNTWDYSADVVTGMGGAELDGYDVEATDGSIGSIDGHSSEVGSSYLIVDTGFWIFGKRRLIPAGVVRSVDHNDKKVHIGLTKDEVKSAPDYDESNRDSDDWYRRSTGDYYDTYSW